MSVKGKALINGVAYTHADIVLNILGVPVVGVTAINYSDPQEMTLNHGTGNQPVSVGIGRLTPQGNITLYKEEVEKLQLVAPGGKLQNIPFFPIGVNFLTEDGKFSRHSLKMCKFKGRNPTSQQGNSAIEESLELLIGEIIY